MNRFVSRFADLYLIVVNGCSFRMIVPLDTFYEMDWMFRFLRCVEEAVNFVL